MNVASSILTSNGSCNTTSLEFKDALSNHGHALLYVFQKDDVNTLPYTKMTQQGDRPNTVPQIVSKVSASTR